MIETMNKQGLEAEIFAITGKRINVADKVFDISKTPRWFKQPFASIRNIFGLPKRTYIEDAYDCEDLNREYKVWLTQKNAKDWIVGSDNGTLSGLSIPVFLAHVSLFGRSESHWILMCRANTGWIYIDYTGSDIIEWYYSKILAFEEVHA